MLRLVRYVIVTDETTGETTLKHINNKKVETYFAEKEKCENTYNSLASAFLDLFGTESTTHLLYTSFISEVVFNFFASTSQSPFRALFFLFFISWVLGPLLPAPTIEEKTLERG